MRSSRYGEISRHSLNMLLVQVQVGRALSALLGDGEFRRRSGHYLRTVALVDAGAIHARIDPLMPVPATM